MCGSMRVCNTSLELHWPSYEYLIGGNRFARTARPQCVKMCYLLHKVALNRRFEAWIAKMHFIKS